MRRHSSGTDPAGRKLPPLRTECTRWSVALFRIPHCLTTQYSTEGGLRVPFVCRYPPFMRHLQPGTKLRAFSTVADLTPTWLELAGVKHPVPPGQATGKWHERTVAGMRGKSWVKYFDQGRDGTEMIHTDDDPAYGWELYGRAGEGLPLLTF